MKKKINKFKDALIKTLVSKLSITIYSILVSVLIWFIVCINVYPTAPVTIRGIKIAEIDLTGTFAAQNNLSVITPLIDSVDIKIKGDRTQVGSIKPEQLSARVVVDTVTKPGDYSLKIEIDNNSGIDYEEIVTIEPAYVNVSFDEIIEKKFDVVAEIPNILVSDGEMYIDELVCTPNTITIKGPLAQINSIEKCVAVVEESGEFSESRVAQTSNLVLYKKDNSIIISNDIVIPKTNFSVDIPILMRRTLNFEFELRNAPSYFNQDLFKSNFTLSSNNITVGAPKDSINTFSWSLGYIDLREVIPGYQKVFMIELPGNFKNISNITEVTATFNSEGYSTKSVTVNSEDFAIINKPQNYNIITDTKRLTLEIFGPAEDLELISAEDITVQIDLYSQSMQNPRFYTPVKILIENYPNCWASNQNITVNLSSEYIPPATSTTTTKTG